MTMCALLQWISIRDPNASQTLSFCKVACPT